MPRYKGAPTAYPASPCGRCGKCKALSLLSCQGLWSPTEPKGVARDPHPLRHRLHQMLAALRNRAENRPGNESALRINRANSPPGEGTLCQGGVALPPPSPACLPPGAPHCQQRAWGTAPHCPTDRAWPAPLREGWGSKGSSRRTHLLQAAWTVALGPGVPAQLPSGLTWERGPSRPPRGPTSQGMGRRSPEREGSILKGRHEM